MTDIKQLKVATIVPGPQHSRDTAHIAQGTRVMLSDGSELSGVTSITLRAIPNGLWTACIEVMPQTITSITADAVVTEVDVTALADESRRYAAVGQS